MGTTRSAQQAQRDVINIQRLLSRMEARVEQDKDNSSSVIMEQVTPSLEYYHTLSTITSIKNAKRLLEDIMVDNNSQKQSLALRLDKVQLHFQSILQNTPNPTAANKKSHSLEHLRPKAITVPEAAASTSANGETISNSSNGLNDLKAAAADSEETPEERAASDLLPLDEEPFEITQARQRRHSSRGSVPAVITPFSSTEGEVPKNEEEEDLSGVRSFRSNESNFTTKPSHSNDRTTSSNNSKSNTTQSLTNLLSHHRSEQESLTEELANMAERLKLNSLEFSNLLEKDKNLLQGAEEKLDGNLTGMIKERDRLKEYKKKGGVTTWFVIGAVIAVMMAWFFMFALMRVF